MCQYLANVILDGVLSPLPPHSGLSAVAVAKVVLAGLIWPDLFAPYGDVSSVPPPSVALYSLLQLHCRGLLKEHIIILTRSTLWGLLLNTQTRACVCAGAMW